MRSWEATVDHELAGNMVASGALVALCCLWAASDILTEPPLDADARMRIIGYAMAGLSSLLFGAMMTYAKISPRRMDPGWLIRRVRAMYAIPLSGALIIILIGITWTFLPTWKAGPGMREVGTACALQGILLVGIWGTLRRLRRSSRSVDHH